MGTGGSRVLLRLSPTRALLTHSGPDGAHLSADDAVYLLDDLGGANAVTPIPLGFVEAPWMSRLDDRTAVVVAGSVGNPAPTAGLFLLSDLGGENRVTPLADLGYVGAPPVASSRSFLAWDWNDGLVRVRIDPEDAFETVPLTSEFEGYPILLSPTSALVLSPGENALVVPFSAGEDDLVYFFPDIDAAAAPVEIAVPHAGEASAVVLSSTRVLLVDPAHEGYDVGRVILLDDLGGENTVTPLPIPFPLRAATALGEDRAAILCGGEDPGVALLTDLGTGNAVRFVRMSALASDPVPLSRSDLLVLRAGSIVHPDGGDDRMTWLSGIGKKFTREQVRVPDASLYVPVLDAENALLGNGRAVLHDWNFADGGAERAHSLQVVSGFEGGPWLRAHKVEIREAAGKAAISARATLRLPWPEQFGRSDLTVRVGTASEVVPGASIVRTKTGFRYSDPNGTAGWLRYVEYDVTNDRLRIEGVAEGLVVAETNPSKLILGLETRDFYVARSLQGKRRGPAILYGRP